MIQNRRLRLASPLKAAITLAFAMTALIPERVDARDQAPTVEEKEACMEDVFRLCSNHIPDRVAIIACLRSKQSRLSLKCRYMISAGDAGKKSNEPK
ncbi:MULTISPECIES: hypothetical protein [unclassified Bradyrhizobium]|uniref:hypothetical protein n=1 Tax=unclassified Bradyrhizobium TaxID=2631580 RepID=UPI00048EEE41|nr:MULTISPECIES: hypothetical protein [unclassified Bradyrhizobium]